MIRYPVTSEGYDDTDFSQYGAEFLHSLLFKMLRIRRIEEKIESRYHEDEMKSPIHLVIGQEASSVGSCAALSDTDLIYSTHRTHGNYLAKGGDLKAMMSELYCRANGCVGSRGGSMHLLDKSVGMAGSSAIVGGIVPIATGTALSAKIRRSDMVTGVYFGDGAVEEGSIWESLNFAALKKLPVIYFCENNFYSVCTPLDKRQPEGVKIYKKAEAFGLRSEQIDGTNVLSVYESTKRAVSLVRAGNGPMFIEMLAYRWRGHGGAGDDSHTGYRDVAEGAQWHQFCPIETYKSALLGAGLLRESLVDDMEHVIADEIDMAFEHAINSPNPTEADLASFLYSE